MFLLLEHIPLSPLTFCVYFYGFGKTANFPKVEGVVLHNERPTLQTVCSVTFGGWLELWLYMFITFLNYGFIQKEQRKNNERIKAN